jgi:delta 1-pyrroline-5-carboxylate dehydrogenase
MKGTRSARKSPGQAIGSASITIITGVFGPVLSVLPYDTIDEVCDYVAARPSPLAAYWYGPADSGLDVFRERTLSGGLSVNDFAVHCAVMAAPFGGWVAAAGALTTARRASTPSPTTALLRPADCR